MKGYEEATGHQLLRRMPVIIRVDGKAFHTLTKQITPDKDPTSEHGFSVRMHNLMNNVSVRMWQNIQNAVMTYTQSDEISILLKDWTNLETQQWFDGKVQKIASVSAALATAHFNKLWLDMFGISESEKHNLPLFDARVFNVPIDDVVNYFIWRQKDAMRNSINFIARKHFSHKQLHGVNIKDTLAMLHDVGVDWNARPLWEQRGSCVVRNPLSTYEPWRSDVAPYLIDDNIPVFTEDREYITEFLREDNEE